jgi:phosphoribosylaminoimidazole-succinocarboxamide synthase
MPDVIETSLSLGTPVRGKVRDVYPAPPDAAGRARLLVVATDRISAFDVVMPTPIPGKGRILSGMSVAWFGLVDRWGVIPTHLLSTDVSAIPGLSAAEREMLRGRSMVVRRCEVVPVECVARGYLEGSGWKDYQATGRVCGVELPRGLRRGDRLPAPIFTPATKEQAGKHDENVAFDRAAAIAGTATMERLRDVTLAIYDRAHAYAAERGVILADTKFEFGFPVAADGARTGEDAILIDEALTPDSSRYWPADRWAPGKEQESFDKQFLREYLQGLCDRGAWDKRAPGPPLPPEVVRGTLDRYEAIDRLLFGERRG